MKHSPERFRAVVWLDRDGTVVDDPGYLDDPDRLVLLDGAAEAIAGLNRAGIAVVLITNQSGIARGKMSRETVELIHAALLSKLAAENARLDGIYLCPHLPAELLPEGRIACDCRKPEPGLVLLARREMGLEGLPSVVVGDKRADLLLADALGVPALLVLTGEGQRTHQDLLDAGEKAPPCANDLRAGLPWILEKLGIA